MPNGITVSAWEYSTTGAGHLINRGGGWDDSGYSLFYFNANLRIELNDAGRQKTITDNARPSSPGWHHSAFTWDAASSSIRVYIDGEGQAISTYAV